jgi:ribosomal-protein-alanine N-acetyltransferase
MMFPKMKELRTERLTLRKLRPSDAKVYYDRIGSSEAVTQFMLWNPHRDLSESVASIEKALRRYEAGKCYRWGIALQEDDSIIGVIELLRFDEEKGSCSFAYMLGEDFWGRGYGTEALKAALSFAFREMEVDAVEADHMEENEPSGAVMRKAGMRYMGTEKEKYEKNGKLHDARVYRIEKSTWMK